mmetsp:Transcript_16940/g.18857  ORF Transcript_16940/g.18857 Transcript_16940/m.18857 type:complete len:88 (+) Transcript_16940:62-325(+)
MSNIVGDLVKTITGLKTPCEGMLSLILGIINIFLPGIGVIVGGVIDGLNISHIIIGLIQLVTCWLVIGWLWAIIWGIIMIIRGASAA